MDAIYNESLIAAFKHWFIYFTKNKVPNIGGNTLEEAILSTRFQWDVSVHVLDNFSI